MKSESLIVRRDKRVRSRTLLLQCWRSALYGHQVHQVMFIFFFFLQINIYLLPHLRLFKGFDKDQLPPDNRLHARISMAAISSIHLRVAPYVGVQKSTGVSQVIGNVLETGTKHSPRLLRFCFGPLQSLDLSKLCIYNEEMVYQILEEALKYNASKLVNPNKHFSELIMKQLPSPFFFGVVVLIVKPEKE